MFCGELDDGDSMRLDPELGLVYTRVVRRIDFTYNLRRFVNFTTWE
jgi:hypothetical protein